MKTSTTYLNWCEFVSQGKNLKDGEQIKIFHCREGRNNDRLYIKRNGKSIVAYCHHCSKSGYYHEDVHKAYSSSRVDTSNNTSTGRCSVESRRNGLHPKPNKLPRDYSTALEGFSARARSWLYRYGITADEIKENKIGYSNNSTSIVLPVYCPIHASLRAYQLRFFGDRVDIPKYITRNLGDSLVGKYINKHNDTTLPIVLVEDIISGIIVGRNYPSYAMLGTHISDEALNFLTTHHDNFVIFLDNDNKQVKISQAKLKVKIEQYANVRIIHHNKDPKECSESELKRLITNG